MKKHLFVLWLFTFSTHSFGYTRITSSWGETPKWSAMPIPYWIHEKGFPSQIANGSEFAAVHESFRTWEKAVSAAVRFSYQGTVRVSGVALDGLNIVSFSDTTTPLGSSTIAATFLFFKREAGSLLMAEADIIFNPAMDFSTSAEPNKFDIQGVSTHEVGHLLGLDHSGLVSSVMTPFATTSQLDQRTLAYDDIAGITEIYPNIYAPSAFGQIQGTIRSGNTAVLGAHVVAVNSEGTPLVSTLSQPDGSYILRYLPAGSYRVFTEPLDLPVSKDNIGGGFYSTARTDFGTTYFGNVSSLTEAAATSVIAGSSVTADIQTLPKSATGLNLTWPVFGVRVARGKSGTLTVGGEDITAGLTITTSTPGIVLGTPTFGGSVSSIAPSSARIPLSVSMTAPLGPKSMAVARGADASIIAGAIVITDTAPSNISVAPAMGPMDGGTPVTVSGANFRPGLNVYFGGLAATAVEFVDSGTVLATAPRNSAGALNVVVINTDGTWGSAQREFTYEMLPPVIRRVTPLSGPAAVTVLIEGENFDPRLQNVTLQFNGVSARVVSITAAAITTIVPAGAVTGPITVSVHGQAVTGPIFTVTSEAFGKDPSKPVIVDEGAATANKTQLAASWTFEATKTESYAFQYAIGTTPGGTDVKAFASTSQNSAVVSGLNLQSGATYYFAVKAVDSLGRTSDAGVSDGIRYDPAYQPKIKVIPSAPAGSDEFTGLALLAPVNMTVVLKAYTPEGKMIFGRGIRNPAVMSLSAGQQRAALLEEFFGFQTFDGWIETEASAAGLGIFVATGARDMSTLDGSVVRDPSADFVLFHDGGSAVFVNPSSRTAKVTMNSLSAAGSQSFSIPPRARFVTTLPGPVRIQSSEALAAIERLEAAGKLSIHTAVPVSDGLSALVFPHGVVGGGYSANLTLVNVRPAAQSVSISFGALSASLRLEANASVRVPVAGLLGMDSGTMTAGAVRVAATLPFGQPAVIGILDIENEKGLMTMGAHASAKEFVFPHVVNGNGMFSGLALATGNSGAVITVDVFGPAGGAPKSATIALRANHQLARAVSELVTGIGTQAGGYMRVRSDQPIWAWEIYGSSEVMASAPPLE